MVSGILTKKQAERIWKMSYRLNDNVKTYMDEVYKSKKGDITEKEIDDLENYKITSWNNIIRTVIFDA